MYISSVGSLSNLLSQFLPLSSSLLTLPPYLSWSFHPSLFLSPSPSISLHPSYWLSHCLLLEWYSPRSGSYNHTKITMLNNLAEAFCLTVLVILLCLGDSNNLITLVAGLSNFTFWPVFSLPVEVGFVCLFAIVLKGIWWVCSVMWFWKCKSYVRWRI